MRSTSQAEGDRPGKARMRRMLICTAPWILIAALGVLYGASIGLERLYYTPNAVSESPNGKYRVFGFRSNQDGVGHAPYGITLSLSRARWLNSPDEGYVIFGGYCRSGASAEWKSDTRIVVRCEQTDPARTLAVRAYGIAIEETNF
jgi:hypothetical protein